MSLVIGCHGRCTNVPAAHTDWRESQLWAFKAGETTPGFPDVSDDEIWGTLERNQLRLLRDRYDSLYAVS
jgi:4-oxalmesaconate hydratase